MVFSKARFVRLNIKAITLFAFVFLCCNILKSQSPLSPARGFNIFVKNGAKVSGSEIQGPLALGGDLTLAGQIAAASQNAGTFKVSNTTIGLLVGGKVVYQSGNSMNLNSNAYVKIGDCTGSKIWYQDQNGANSNIKITSGDYNGNPNINLQTNANNLGVSESVNPVCESNLIDFSAAFANLQSNSTSISSCTNTLQLTEANGTPITDYTNLTNEVRCTLSTGLNILNITGNSLNGIQQFKFLGSRPDANHYLVININAAGNFNFEGIKSSDLGSGEGAYILYNFYNATTLTINAKDQVPGTIFAPFADITKQDNRNLIGQVIGQSFTMTDGLVQYALFTFQVPGCGGCVLPDVQPIVGASAVCKSEVTTLTNVTPGGVWSSSDTTIATVDNAGKVKGITPGTVTIKYTVTNACGATTKSQTMTVNAAPTKPFITASSSTDFCEGGSVTLSSSSPEFNQWYMDGNKIANATNSTYIASIAGRYSLVVYNSNGCGSVPANSVYVTTSQGPNKPVITPDGPTAFCQGKSVDLVITVKDDHENHQGDEHHDNYEYQWYKNAVLIPGETDNSLRVTSSGTYSATLTKSSGCTSVQSDGIVVTVNPIPTSSPISGGSSVCKDGRLQLSNTNPGGVWSSSNTYIATVDANGLVTGVKPGIADIRYTLSNANNCTSTVSKTIVVNEILPLNPIVGSNNTCVNGSTALKNDTPGGVWTSNNTAIATVSSNGNVTGVSAGTTSIKYTVANESNCVSFVEHAITVYDIPVVSPIIVPQDQICINNSVTLSNATVGGTWVSTNPSIATVSANGVVSGVKVGTVLIMYSVQNAAGCINAASTNITVNPIPNTPSISYNSSLTFCEGQNVILTSSITTGNRWYKNGTLIATGNGLQSYTATSTGIYTVSILTTTGCEGLPSEGVTVTVNPIPTAPVVSPGSSTNICDGGSVLLTSSSPSGNQWFKNGISIKGATNNTYQASKAGTYTVQVTNNSCSSLASNAIVVTVNSLPAIPSISSGTTTICAGGSVLLTAVPVGTVTSYQWYLNAIAINAATSVTYTATQAGDYTVTVGNTNGCTTSSTDIVTVIVESLPSQPSISAAGPTTFCSGASVVLTSSSATGNTWYKDGAIINFRNGGQSYTANSAGTYTVVVANAAGCSSIPSNGINVIINSIPSKPSINTTDPTTICAPLTATLTSDASTGNQWYKNNVLIVGATNQNYIASTTGNYTVVVTNASGCASLASSEIAVTINTSTQIPSISTIAPTTFCEGGSVNLFTSKSNTSTYQWLKDGVAITGATAFSYNATGSGNYTVTVNNAVACVDGTSTATTVTVNPIPNIAAITGDNAVCKNASTNFSSATPAGIWSSDNDAIATVSATGLVTGISTGTVAINYTVTQIGCSNVATKNIQVNPLPTVGGISGPSSVCTNSTINLKNNTTGGIWSSSNIAIATVNPSTGIVTGVSAGTASILYTVTSTSGCSNSASKNITVNAVPSIAPITGNAPICIGRGITLNSTTVGGIWTSDDANIADVSSTGVVIGYGAGNTTIRYTVTSNNCTNETSVIVTVNALPTVSAITGNTSSCIAVNTTLSNSTAGGVWSSNNNSVATVSASGVVTAVSAGTANITYLVSTGAGCQASANTSFTVFASPVAPIISAESATSFCAGDSVILISNSFRNNQWYKNGVAISNATGYYLVVNASGTYTLQTSNNNGCGSANSNSIPVTVNALPSTPVLSASGPTSFCNGGSVVLTATTGSSYQWYKNEVLIVGAVSNSYTATTSGTYSVITTNSSGCRSIASNGTVVTVNAIPQMPLINHNGPLSFCVGGNVALSTNSLIGNQWYKNDIIIPGATSQTFIANATGIYTVKKTNNSGCTSVSSLPDTVVVNSLPATPTISANGPLSFCEAGSLVLTSSGAVGNQWYKNNKIINNATSQTYSVTSSGNYTVVVSNVSGCTATSASSNVTINKNPNVAPITGDLFICNGSSSQMSSATSGGVWSSGNNTIATINATGLVNAVSVGTVAIFYKVTNANGCSSTVTKPLSVQAAPSNPSVSNSSPTTFCEGGSVYLNSSATSGNQWYKNNILMDGETDQSLFVKTSGNYSVAVTNNNGCISNGSSSPTTVTVNALPNKPTITSTGSTIICAGSSVQLTSSASTGNQWFRNGILIVGATNVNYIATLQGNYSVQVTNASGCGSIISDLTYVFVLSLPTTPIINADGPVSFCDGDSVLLKSNNSTGNQWYRNNVLLPGATNPIYIANSTGLYTVSTISSNGCVSNASNAILVNVNSLPTVSAITGASTICVNANSTFSNATTSGIWSSNNESIAIVNAVSGVVTGVRAGIVNIKYSVTNSNNCITSVLKPVLVTPIPNNPTISIDGNTSFCAGSSVNLTSTYANGYQWYKNAVLIVGATNRTYTANSTGLYTVITTNILGCTGTSSDGVQILVNDLPSTPVISAGGPTTFCAGGSVVLSSSVASGNQWYLNGVIIRGATSATLTVSASGVYTVVATNGAGCTSATSSSTTVTVNALPVVPGITGSKTVCVGNTVSLSNTVSGGVWSSNNTAIATVNSSTGLVTGISGGITLINYTVTNASGCSTVVTTAFKVSSTPELATISTNTPTSFCAGGSVDLISSSSAGNQWYLKGTIIAGATSQVYTAIASGNYSVTVTSGLGCIANGSSAATTVTVNALPTVSAITGTTAVCVNSTTQLSNASTGGVWSSSNEGIATVNGTTGLVTGVTAGSASISYVVTNASGCSATATTNITVNALPVQPTVTAGGSTVFCAGSSVVLTSSAGVTYQWYKNGTAIVGATAVSYTATTSGTYSVSVGNSNGCMSVTSTGTPVTMNDLPSTPVISAGGPTTFCAGGSVVLSSSVASGNQWYLNGVIIRGATSATLTVNASGVYTVVATNGAGCTSATSSSTTVTVNALPVVPGITGSKTVCVGNTVSLVNAVSGGVWSSNNTAIATVNSSTGLVTGISGGITLISYTVTNASGCSTVVTTAFKVSSTPELATISTNTPTSFCAGGSVDLISSSSAGNQWYLNGAIIAGATSQVYTASASGNYSVTVTSGLGCIANGSSAATTVTVNALPTVSAITGTTAVCVNSTTQLSNASTGGVWSSSNEGIATVNGTTGLITGVTAGSATISYVVTNASGCSATATTNATVNALPVQPTVTAGGSTVFCAGSSVVLTSSAGVSYQWYKNGTAIVGATAVSYTATTSGNYSVSVGNSNGCMSVTSTGTPVTMNDLPSTPVISAGGPTTFCAGGSVILSSSVASGNQWYLNGVIIRGATSATLTVSASGVYTVVATNGAGCTSATSSSTTVTVNALPVVPGITGSKTVCVGNTVSLVNAVSGGVWSSNNTAIATVNSSTGLVTGISGGITLISYTVTNASGCSTVVTTAFKVSSTPELATISTNTPTSFCAGGSVDLISSSSAGNQWYLNGSMIAGATSQVYTASASGNYSVTVTSGLGCIANGSSAATTVTVNALPTVSAITGTTAVCVNSTTQLSNASAGGVWSSSNEGIATVNGTTGLITGVTAGSVSISYVVTNASGCSATATTNVTVNALPVQPTVTAGGSTVFCAGSSVVLTSSAGVSYQWYKNGTAIVGATAVSYTATTSGTYSVSVGNSNGCMSVTSTGTPVTMNDLPSTPVISAGGPTTFCAGGSVVLSSSAASGNQWYLNGAIINAATDQQIKVEHSGSYSLVNIVNGCASLVSNTIVVTENSLPAAPVIAASGPITFCAGNSVLLTSSNGSTYQWLKDGVGIVGQTNKTITVTTGGSYQVSIKDANGCRSLLLSNKIAVSVNELPVKPEIYTNRPSSFCNGDSSILQSSAVTGNQWYKDGIAILGATSQNLKVKVAGLYTVKVTNESGCLSTVSEGINITVTNLPVTPVITVVGSSNICKGDSVFLKSSASSGNEWYLNNELIPGATSTGIYASKSGSYTVIETNIFGCNSAPANSKLVVVNALPDTPSIATSGKTAFCAGGSVVLTSSAGNAYQWIRNGIDIVGANSQNYTATATGLYSVSVANLAGCRKSSATVIPVNAVPLPVGNIIGSTIQFICTNGSQTLEAIGGASYKWFKDAVLIPGNTTNKLVASLPGLYSVSVLNEFGCETQAAKTVQIFQIQKPKADYVYDIYCTNKIVNFQSTSNVSGSGPVNYIWTDGNVISKFSSSSPSFVFKNPGTYNIKLVVTPYFCPGSADSITKSVKIEDPVAGIRMAAIDVAVNDLVQLQARNIGTNYLWSPATYLSSSTIANPTIQTTAQQEYKIKIDQLSGCTTTDTLLVRIHNANRVYIPTVFSPNGDGLNDKLYLNYVGIKQLKVHRIYNRWGKMMYETTNMNEGWDGTVFGVKQPMDSYTVIVEAIDKNGNLIRSQGTITLLR